MRKGWRTATIGLALVLYGTLGHAAPNEPKDAAPPVRLTVEIDWSLSKLPALPNAPEPTPALLEVPGGRVIEAVGWPAAGPVEPAAQADGSWRLGPAPAGRARARIEAPIGASLRVHAGGQVYAFPLLYLLDGPQRTAPSALADVGVQRLAWDALEVRHDGDGTAPPGGSWPLAVGLNVLTPEPAEVMLRLQAELRPARGGPPVWQVERTQVVPTDPGGAPLVPLEVPAPRDEGTYVLDLRASWEPTASPAGSRLGRWIKRRRTPPSASMSRRISLEVAGDGPIGPSPTPGGADAVVDRVEMERLRPGRMTAAGRAPLASPRAGWDLPTAALDGLQRGDRLLGLIGRGGEAPELAPADGRLASWSAFGLRLPHPGRPHRLTITFAGKARPEAAGVALVAPGDPARVLLDACVGPGGEPTASWLVWPDAAEPVLVVFNRDGAAPVRLAAAELVELAAEPPPLVLFETHADAPRTLALHLRDAAALSRFGGAIDDDRVDPREQGRNLGAYLAHVGASTVVLPDGLADRDRRRALDGQADEDATGPDRLAVLLRMLRRRNLSAFVDVPMDGPLPGLPAPDSAEALTRGLVRVGRDGRADGPAYQPLRAEVRAAMRRRVEAAIAPRRDHPNLAGLLIRLGPGATLPGGPGTGLDDATFEQFVRDGLSPEAARTVPGRGGDADRLAARLKYVTGAGETPWQSWRAREVGALYAELAKAVRTTAPGAVLAVATPGLDDGPAGREARRCDQAGLQPDHAWRAVGLDLRLWPGGDGGPVVLRGVAPSAEGLARDLALDPDLDAQVAARAGRGLLVLDAPPADARDAGPDAPVRLVATPTAEGADADMPLGHGLAVLDARWVALSALAAGGREERLRHFARVLRGLPAPAEAGPPPARLDSGVAVRTWSRGGKTYLALANDTPFTLRLSTNLPVGAGVAVEDLGRGLNLTPTAAANGGRSLVVRLDPYFAATVRVGQASVTARDVALYFDDDPAAVAAALRERVGRLGGGGPSAAGPANPGFESDQPPLAEIRLAQDEEGGLRPGPAGWSAAGDASNTLAIDEDRPHAGRGSLRLDARALPTAAVGDWFAPPGGTSLTLHAWLRADGPDARVRVRVDGLAGGKPVARQAERPVGVDWTPITLAVADLPTGGLDRARFRFEPLTAGTFWVDDLALTGQGPSEPERRARRVILAAIYAFEEKRYADFARLASLHWARPPATTGVTPAPLPPLPTAERPEAPVRTGRAPDLPAGRRVR